MSEQPPLATVIVVCWNSADVLGRCLRHLLAQDYPNYEVIVVDDGSTDETRQVAEASLGRGQLTIVQSTLNRGCPHARNLGLRQARGEFVAFIDADGFAAPNWLSEVIETFRENPDAGGVASTVFMDFNPMLLNGAGGTVNQQGWAADLCMNVPYARAEIPQEALYAMGCGMAVRRSALERVGVFDDRMFNYYDDVDYGIRIWRAGHRVVVAPDAWIDHGFGHSGGDSPRKQLLCERHRMRVVLSHWPARSLVPWMVREWRATQLAHSPRREIKLRALRWNVRHFPSLLRRRWSLRSAPRVPGRLLDRSWGEDFPPAAMPMLRPDAREATDAIDFGDPDVTKRLAYGWYVPEEIGGRMHAWSTTEAAALIRLERPARRMRLEYTQAPVDTGGVDVKIRRRHARELLRPAWSAHLRWQYIERCVQNHPLDLSPGDYEVVFATRRAFRDPPAENRRLGVALAALSFHDSFSAPASGLEMGSAQAGEQLVNGWYELERNGERAYRWADEEAAAVVRVPDGVSSMDLFYCMPPGATAGTRLTLSPSSRRAAIFTLELPYVDGAWRSERFGVSLPAGEYLASFRSEQTWSNVGGRDTSSPPENRSLGFALGSLCFDRDGSSS